MLEFKEAVQRACLLFVSGESQLQRNILECADFMCDKALCSLRR